MSDEPPQQSNSGPDGDQPKKRRRRRRRNKNKPAQDGSTQDAAANPQSNTQGPQGQANDSPRDQQDRSSNPPRPRSNSTSGNRPPKTGGGYRGKNQKNNSGDGQASPIQSPQRDTAGGRGKPSGAKTPRNNAAAKGAKAPDRPGNTAGKPKAKKRRKPRTKQCINCYTPCTTIHRVRIDYRKQWVFVCDICWPTRCVDNPHYEFGGTWVSGRIVKPESQLRDEWLAKQKQKKSPAKPRPERPHSNDKPAADPSARENLQSQTPAEAQNTSRSPDDASASPAAQVNNASAVPEVAAGNKPLVNSETPVPPDESDNSSNPEPSDQHTASDPLTEERQGG